MKSKIFFILSFFCLLFAGCSDDVEVVNISNTEFKDIPADGSTYQVKLDIAGEWTATSLVDWCSVTKTSGYGPKDLSIIVEGNLGEERTGEIVIYSAGSKKSIYLKQAGSTEGLESHYKLPIVFHILYNDPNDRNQNPDSATIYKILDDVNAFYAKASESSPNLKLEFVPAQFDPQGNKMDEPGIERVKWVTSTLSAEDVMSDNTNKYTHFLWEPNDYINVLVYQFSNSQILGISTFPYSTESHPLEGTDIVPDMNISLENLTYVRGVSLNSSYIYNSDDYFVQMGLVPDEWKDLMNKQNKTYITLAHELGHYLGLFHTFSENIGGPCKDTDKCSDTPTYDKYGENGYDVQVQTILQMISINPDFAATFDWGKLFLRTDEKGEQFESHNIMDYAYSYLDEFSQQQRDRVRHVLNYSPMIPGPKSTRSTLSRSVSGPMDLPFSISDGYPVKGIK